MRKVKLAFARLVFFLGIQLRVYTTWSKLHRILFDGPARKKQIQLPTFTNVEDMVPFIRGFVWREDSWIDLGDAVCTPEMVWYRYVYAEDGEGDCDEFAVFESNVIQKSIDEGVWKSAIDDPEIMTVMWMGQDGTIAGHNVCLLRRGDSFGYMDYDMPAWCGSKERTAMTVLANNSPDSDLIGWAVHSPTLKKREVHV